MNDTGLTNTEPTATTEPEYYSPALAESAAEDAAIEAAQAAYEKGELPGLPRNGEPEPQSLSQMLGAGDPFPVAGRLCRLSALSLLETNTAQMVLNAQHPLLYAAVLTDPPAGGTVGEVDAAAVAEMAGTITGRDDFSVDEARAGLRKLALRLPEDEQRAFASIVVASLRKRTPELQEADVLGALSLGEMIGAVRQIFAISGGLAEVFGGG